MDDVNTGEVLPEELLNEVLRQASCGMSRCNRKRKPGKKPATLLFY
ncbi:hypothetical protein [Gorillibacterium timonense]|nr:hypothetical protein [Gorillibacterium timonense]